MTALLMLDIARAGLPSSVLAPAPAFPGFEAELLRALGQLGKSMPAGHPMAATARQAGDPGPMLPSARFKHAEPSTDGAADAWITIHRRDETLVTPTAATQSGASPDAALTPRDVPPVRLHAQEGDAGPTLWIGLDQGPRAPQLDAVLAHVQTVFGEAGRRLNRIYCNGRVVYDDAGTPESNYRKET